MLMRATHFAVAKCFAPRRAGEDHRYHGECIHAASKQQLAYSLDSPRSQRVLSFSWRVGHRSRDLFIRKSLSARRGTGLSTRHAEGKSRKRHGEKFLASPRAAGEAAWKIRDDDLDRVQLIGDHRGR